MKIEFEAYQQDNGHYGVCVTIERKEACPLVFTSQKNALTDAEAIEATIKESVWVSLLKN